MSGQKVWSEAEDEIFRSLFPSYADIVKALPHRTYFSRVEGMQEHGLVVPRPPFTVRELSLVRRLCPTADRDELLKLMPGREWDHIKLLAKRNGIHRIPKSYKSTGVAVLDQIDQGAGNSIIRCRT